LEQFNLIVFYHFIHVSHIHVSHTFAETELVKDALQQLIFTIDFTPKKLSSLYLCSSFVTCQ